MTVVLIGVGVGVDVDGTIEELDAGKTPSVSDENFAEALENSWRPYAIPEGEMLDSGVITLVAVRFSELE